MEIMELLRAKGAEIAYSDPYVPEFPRMREHYFELCSIKLTLQVLKETDCVIIATDHDDFDYEMIRANAKTIIDTRGVYRKPADHIVRA